VGARTRRGARPGLVVAGVGIGLLFAPIVGVALQSLPPNLIGGASGVVTTVQQLGGAMGVALLGNVYDGTLASTTPASFRSAFAVGALCLAAVALVVAAFLRRIPEPPAASRR
jgi:fucose permease